MGGLVVSTGSCWEDFMGSSLLPSPDGDMIPKPGEDPQAGGLSSLELFLRHFWLSQYSNTLECPYLKYWLKKTLLMIRLFQFWFAVGFWFALLLLVLMICLFWTLWVGLTEDLQVVLPILLLPWTQQNCSAAWDSVMIMFSISNIRPLIYEGSDWDSTHKYILFCSRRSRNSVWATLTCILLLCTWPSNSNALSREICNQGNMNYVPYYSVNLTQTTESIRPLAL